MNRIAMTLLAGVAFVGFASATQAADLIVEAPMAPMYEAASGNWDGPYIGVFGGYAAGTYDVTGPGETDMDGYLLGVNAGVNFTLTEGIVAGVVGDVAWSNVDSDSDPLQIDWTGSVRGLVGFDGGSFLPYLTAGVAFANGEIDGNDGTSIGWTAGAGIQFAATEDLSIDLQYRYSDYGTADYGPYEATLTTHQLTVGLNFKF
ncbi:MAG: porin family protein [Devosia sp.]|nr:porin family protein [Devosia sp.]